MGFGELARRMQQLSDNVLAEIVYEILSEHKNLLEEIQKYQLYAGQNAKGEKLAPSYLDDPFFKDSASAQRYANWKNSLSHNYQSNIFEPKDVNTPNLIITGTLVYDTIFASITNKSLIIGARSSILSKLESKYKEPIGLNQTAWDYYAKNFLVPELKQRVRQFLQQ